MTKSIIFFDGLCNLCNSSIQFIIKRDKKGKFSFASLQSKYAKENLPYELIDAGNLQSIVYKKGEDIQVKSAAALTISKELSGLWPMLYIFIIIPMSVRDFVYDVIAKNRYKWFGKKDQCMIPSKELKSRFLD